MKQTKHNDRRDWLAFHAASVREYLAAWRDAAARAQMGVAPDEAAGCLLEHTALLWRYTNDEEVRAGLLRWSAKERTALVHAACRYLLQSSYAAQAASISSIDALADDEMNTAETLLLARDGMQAALDLARALVAAELAQDHALRHALALTTGTLAQGDEYLLERPDIISVASRILEPLRALVKAKLDHNAYWWFYEARARDAQFEKELASPATFARALGLSARVFQRSSQPLPQPGVLFKMRRLFADTAHNLKAICAPLALPAAAKTRQEQHSRVMIWRKSHAALLAALRAQRPQQLIKDRIAPYNAKPRRSASAYAELAFSRRPLPNAPEHVGAQWRLHAPRCAPRSDCDVLVVDRRTGAIIGAARYAAAGKDITLTEGCWADFDPARLPCEDITLILLAGT